MIEFIEYPVKVTLSEKKYESTLSICVKNIPDTFPTNREKYNLKLALNGMRNFVLLLLDEKKTNTNSAKYDKKYTEQKYTAPFNS